MSLNMFLERENSMRKLFKKKPLDLADSADRQEIASMIDCRLSPENLSCDGEISHAEAKRKYSFLSKAAKELIKLDSTVKIYEI